MTHDSSATKYRGTQALLTATLATTPERNDSVRSGLDEAIAPTLMAGFASSLRRIPLLTLTPTTLAAGGFSNALGDALDADLVPRSAKRAKDADEEEDEEEEDDADEEEEEVEDEDADEEEEEEEEDDEEEDDEEEEEDDFDDPDSGFDDDDDEDEDFDDDE